MPRKPGVHSPNWGGPGRGQGRKPKQKTLLPEVVRKVNELRDVAKEAGIDLEIRLQENSTLAELTLVEFLPSMVQRMVSLALRDDRKALEYCIDRVLGRTTEVKLVRHSKNTKKVQSLLERLRELSDDGSVEGEYTDVEASEREGEKSTV